MSIKLNISYTYEYEKEYVLGLLQPLLDSVNSGYRVLDGHEYSHVYIPRKGSLTLPNRPENNM
ncbi:hypothetical protein [Anaerotignum sp.]|nr:hypothetical protein [Anaerotignum sp.]MBQ7759314.1 hypothetical protein [Anaerotignum sp.]